MNKEEVEIFYPKNQKEWRLWLQKNHSLKQSVWLVYYKKASTISSITWSNAVDEALCFGWIDSKRVSIDNEKSHQFFSKRKAKSTWSKINKEKVVKLIEAGMMTQAGLDIIETAKQNGSWTILDEIDALIIPDDLATALNATLNAMECFLSLSKSKRKLALYQLMIAKRQETREKRIAEILEFIDKNSVRNKFVEKSTYAKQGSC